MTEDALTAAIPLAHLIPLLVAVVAHRAHRAVGQSSGRLRDLLAVRTSLRSLTAGVALATLVVLIVPITQVVLATALDWAPWGPGPAAKAALPLVPLAAVMASLTALGEELGWRGYLQSVTQQWGFWRSAAAVSGAFTAFHVPLMWHSWASDAMPGAEAVAATLNIAAGSFALSALRDRIGTVWPAVWGHGLLNSAVLWLHGSAAQVDRFGAGAFWIFTAVGWLGWFIVAAATRRHPAWA